ncbi:MAG: hypothetical protein PHX82_05310 [Paracoccaceae bacterium]|nr:hypothetical protein [Paracoccaceae bacterium]
MRTSTITLSLIALLAAGAASAQAISPAQLQLAARLGVDASQYSMSQLVALNIAKSDDNRAAPFSLTPVGEASGTTAGDRQLAAQAGVNAANYTTAELVALNDALRAGKFDAAEAIISHGGKDRTDTITAGRAQLAAQAGVNAADYTVAQLVAMSPRTSD